MHLSKQVIPKDFQRDTESVKIQEKEEPESFTHKLYFQLCTIHDKLSQDLFGYIYIVFSFNEEISNILGNQKGHDNKKKCCFSNS